MNVLLKRMFENRHYSVDFFDDIAYCDGIIPKNIDVLCAHLHNYHVTGQQIVLLTDFDFDGICSGVIGFGGLAELGFNVSLYMPDTALGYGFNADTIDDLVSQYPDCKAILTGDVGITAFDGIRRARDLGLDIFVTDHHKGFDDAGAVVTVDPQRDCDPDAYSYICGAAVMYHVLRYYAEHYTTCPGFAIQQIDRLRVFAGFGTVSDSMPVYHENRGLIRDAINICKFLYADKQQDRPNAIPGCEVYRRIFYGLYVMFECFADYNKLKDSFKIDEEFFAFYVAPAFNSIKRLSEDISIAYSVFFGGPDIAKASMDKIMQFNELRKKIVAEKYEELYNTPQPWSPYIYITDTLPGICGLLAQKVMSDTGEPALVLVSDPEDGTYSGSGRSPSWYPFLDIAGRESDGRWYPAGHNPAFGIGVDDEACMDALFDFLKDSVPEHKPDASELEFVPDFVISTLGDGDIGLDIEVMHEFLHDINCCAPFGNGFPKHQMVIRFRSTDGTWKLLTDGTHLRIDLPYGINVMCFNQGYLFPGRVDMKQLPDVIEVVGSLGYNTYNGVSGIQILGEFRDPESIVQEGEIYL